MSVLKRIAGIAVIAVLGLFQQAAAQYSVDVPHKQVSVENEGGF